MHALLAIVRRARAGHLHQSDLGDPTFTVTSLGELGVQAVFPAIVPPQVAGAGFGKVVEQPSAVAGTIVCSPVVTDARRRSASPRRPQRRPLPRLPSNDGSRSQKRHDREQLRDVILHLLQEIAPGTEPQSLSGRPPCGTPCSWMPSTS
jgi:hypothetical protein